MSGYTVRFISDRSNIRVSPGFLRVPDRSFLRGSIRALVDSRSFCGSPVRTGPHVPHNLTYYYYIRTRLYPGYIHTDTQRNICIIFLFAFVPFRMPLLMGKHPASRPGV